MNYELQFNQPQVYQNGTTLSPAEASRIQRNAATRKQIIAEFLQSHPMEQFTADAISLRTGIDIHYVRSRLTELKQEGFVVKFDEKEKGLKGVGNRVWGWRNKQLDNK